MLMPHGNGHNDRYGHLGWIDCCNCFLVWRCFPRIFTDEKSKMLLISVGFAAFLVNAFLHIPERINEDYAGIFSENIFLFILQFKESEKPIFSQLLPYAWV
jgi:hypothetical protein